MRMFTFLYFSRLIKKIIVNRAHNTNNKFEITQKAFEAKIFVFFILFYFVPKQLY